MIKRKINYKSILFLMLNLFWLPSCAVGRLNFEGYVYEEQVKGSVGKVPVKGAIVLFESKKLGVSDTGYTDDNGYVGLEVPVEDKEKYQFTVTISRVGFFKIVTFINAQNGFTSKETFFMQKVP